MLVLYLGIVTEIHQIFDIVHRRSYQQVMSEDDCDLLLFSELAMVCICTHFLTYFHRLMSTIG